MHAAGKPRWQQLTALVSLSAGGVITGFSFIPGPAADLASPIGMPIHLMALQKSAQPAQADDAMLRSAIVNVADYYLRMARDRTPAEMEAIIWQNDSVNGADHGQSCAAFASLTLELAAQVVGQQSWVTGGTSYPWPIHKWADVRVDPNPASPGVDSILQATVTCRGLGTGRCFAATSRSSRATPAAFCTPSAATRYRTSRSTRTNSARRLARRGSSDSSTTASFPAPRATRRMAAST